MRFMNAKADFYYKIRNMNLLHISKMLLPILFCLFEIYNANVCFSESNNELCRHCASEFYNINENIKSFQQEFIDRDWCKPKNKTYKIERKILIIPLNYDADCSTQETSVPDFCNGINYFKKNHNAVYYDGITAIINENIKSNPYYNSSIIFYFFGEINFEIPWEESTVLFRGSLAEITLKALDCNFHKETPYYEFCRNTTSKKPFLNFIGGNIPTFYVSNNFTIVGLNFRFSAMKKGNIVKSLFYLDPITEQEEFIYSPKIRISQCEFLDNKTSPWDFVLLKISTFLEFCFTKIIFS
jgi:hypothetical protein